MTSSVRIVSAVPFLEDRSHRYSGTFSILDILIKVESHKAKDQHHCLNATRQTASLLLHVFSGSCVLFGVPNPVAVMHGANGTARASSVQVDKVSFLFMLRRACRIPST